MKKDSKLFKTVNQAYLDKTGRSYDEVASTRSEWAILKASLFGTFLLNTNQVDYSWLSLILGIVVGLFFVSIAAAPGVNIKGYLLSKSQSSTQTNVIELLSIQVSTIYI